MQADILERWSNTNDGHRTRDYECIPVNQLVYMFLRNNATYIVNNQ